MYSMILSITLNTSAYCRLCCAVSQVATRLVTFSMNLLVARQLTPEAYGVRSQQQQQQQQQLQS
jgi:hypothetical protein